MPRVFEITLSARLNCARLIQQGEIYYKNSGNNIDALLYIIFWNAETNKLLMLLGKSHASHPLSADGTRETPGFAGVVLFVPYVPSNNITYTEKIKYLLVRNPHPHPRPNYSLKGLRALMGQPKMGVNH